MRGVFRTRSGPNAGQSWEVPPATPSTRLAAERALGLQPDRRREPRVYDPTLNRAWAAYRIVVARAKHKPNAGLDAKAAKQAARELRR